LQPPNPALQRLRQEDHKFKASLGYHSKTLSNREREREREKGRKEERKKG
jgi:hypothetical protein